jgi:ATP-dependent exoDNAse (exonuclease V) beta subunit
MLSDCGYVWAPGTVAGDNVEAFLHLARAKGSGRTLPEFLRELESIEKGGVSSESDLSDEDQGNCVQVMTAHAAKGLEFPVTIVAALHQGTRRGAASVSFTPEHGLGMKWRNPFVKKTTDRDALEDSWARANSDAVKRREDEEANRLFYVAMTRAEEHLILTYTVGKRKPQNWAALLDGFFALAEATPSNAPVTVARDGFEASVLVTDSDPPLLSNVANEQTAAEVEVLARPAAGARDEAAVNVTSIAVFSSCPRKYFLQRYLGWSPGARGEDRDPADDDESCVSAADLGTAAHALLAGRSGPYPKEAIELANVFLRSELGRRAGASARSAREWDFVAEIEGAMVRGSIDLWFEDSGGIEIVDYKTDAAVKTAEYAPQLALYAIAIEKAFGNRPVRAWLHFLRHDAVEEVVIGETALAEARDLVRRLRAAQDSFSFELHEGAHCYLCPFHRSMCPAGL